MDLNSKNIKVFLFVLFFVNVSFSLHAQLNKPAKRERFPSYFGLQFKPLIPGDFLGTSQVKLNQDELFATFTQKFGYSFGANVRVGLTKLISLETGINQVQRNYDIDFSVPDSNLTAKNDFGIINYDIPINALFYIQLTDKFFMNASLGGSIVFNPSDVRTKVAASDGKSAFVHEGRRISKLAFETSANFGVEFRTEKSGIFYIGTSGRIPLRPIFDVAATYERGGYKQKAIGSMTGTYLSFDFRYYLPNIKTKGQQFIPGPVEQ